MEDRERPECANMGKMKRLELWWQMYRTSLPVRDLEDFRPMDSCWTECTETVMTKVIVAFRHIANAPKIRQHTHQFSCWFCCYLQKDGRGRDRSNPIDTNSPTTSSCYLLLQGTQTRAKMVGESQWQISVTNRITQWLSYISKLCLCYMNNENQKFFFPLRNIAQSRF